MSSAIPHIKDGGLLIVRQDKFRIIRVTGPDAAEFPGFYRVVWNDQFQGAANAQYAKELGLKKIFILNDGETYGLGIATLFAEYAEKLGIQILGNQKWDKKASSYESLASRISSGRATLYTGI